jgi:hypothetical protein
LAVLSKPLKYAVDCELIAKAPKIGMFKVERPRSPRGTSSSTHAFSRQRRIVAMLGARGKNLAKTSAPRMETQQSA